MQPLCSRLSPVALILAISIHVDIIHADPEVPLQSAVVIPDTIALFGIRTTWNGESVFSEKVLGKRAVMRFLVDSLDWPTGFKKPKLELIDDPEDHGLVWAHLPLPPGTYCLVENPASLARKEKSYAFYPKGLRFQLSFGEEVHYLGTLAYHFSGRHIRQPDDMVFGLEQDRPSAERIVRAQIEIEAGIAESPFESLDEVRALAASANANIVVADRGNNLLVASKVPLLLGEQDLYALGSLAISAAPAALSGAQAASSSFVLPGWETGAYQAMGALIVLGVADNFLRAQKHQNLASMIEEELTGKDPASELVKNLSNQLGTQATTGAEDARLLSSGESSERDVRELLQIQFQKISVRECSGGMCFEFAIRARIWNHITNRYTYEELFVYSNPTSIAMEPEDLMDYYNSGQPMYPLLYETRLPGASKRMKRLNFSRNSKKTRALLHEELGNAITQTEAAILRRLQAN